MIASSSARGVSRGHALGAALRHGWFVCTETPLLTCLVRPGSGHNAMERERRGGVVSRAKFALGVPVAMAGDLVLFALLRRARPRPLGLSITPAVKPAMLSSAGQSEPRSFSNVVLCYGRPLAVAGQLIEVETCFTERDCVLPALEQTITRAELRDQAWSRQDWENDPGVFSPDPEVQVTADGFGHAERIVVVAGLERTMPVISHGRYEALRFAHDSMVVTAVARLGFPDKLRFEVVEDLEPYLAELRRFVLSWLRFWEG